MLRTRVHWRVTPLTTAARFMTAKARKQAPRWEQPGLLRASLLTQNQGRGGWGVSLGASLVAQMAKKLPVMPETQVQSLGGEDSLEEQMVTPLEYSCLGNPMDRGTWWVTVHGVAKSRIRLRV